MLDRLFDWSMDAPLQVLAFALALFIGVPLAFVCFWHYGEHCVRSHVEHIEQYTTLYFIKPGAVLVPIIQTHPAHDETVCDEWVKDDAPLVGDTDAGTQSDTSTSEYAHFAGHTPQTIDHLASSTCTHVKVDAADDNAFHIFATCTQGQTVVTSFAHSFDNAPRCRWLPKISSAYYTTTREHLTITSMEEGEQEWDLACAR